MPETERKAREAGQIARAAMLAAIAACFIALLGTTVAILFARSETNNTKANARNAKLIAGQAKAIADQNRRRITINAAIGVERRRVIQAEDIKICRRFHTFYVIVNSVEQKAVDQAQHLVDSGAYDSLDPALKRAARRQLTEARRFLIRLKKVDCHSVPSLTPTGKPRKTVSAHS